MEIVFFLFCQQVDTGPMFLISAVISGAEIHFVLLHFLLLFSILGHVIISPQKVTSGAEIHCCLYAYKS
jgi:hypothetical protein